ncbi:REST corepressor 1 isoform X2 [Rhipicephalus microplus]|uniref:REST corepressor 1 isoform X2 n=1 Tax=Rhipicephalus microplus TaxID=6941 RepID=UPI003F6CEFDC
MVLADRNDDSRIGRRSHTSSPNGHLTDEGSATDESEQDHGMRVGHDFQAVIPDIISATDPCPEFTPERALLVWSPCPDISDSKLDEYMTHAKEKYSYNAEQLPDKTIPSLVKYYYSWKKTRTRTSLMDRQARRLAGSREDGSDGASEAGSENDSDMEVDNKEEAGAGCPCSSCGAPMTQAYTSSKGSLCASCYQHWKRSGGCKGALAPGGRKHHDRQPPIRGGGGAANRRRPPRGMRLEYQDLVAMATGPPGQGDAILRAMDSELVALKRQVQNNKQMISQLRHKTAMDIENLRPLEANARVNARWTNDELLIAVQGIRKYGRDFKTIAEVIGNKTEAHVRSFFVNYRRRYNLDAVLQEFEAEHGITPGSDDTKPAGETDQAAAMKEASGPNSRPGSPCAVTAMTGAAVLANGSGGGPVGAGNPPPLLRPPPGSPSSQPLTVLKGPTQLAQAAPRQSGNWSILQQPPPLIRPTATSTTTTMHTKPAQMHNVL